MGGGGREGEREGGEREMDIEDFVPFVDDIIILRCFSSALKRWPFLAH